MKILVDLFLFRNEETVPSAWVKISFETLCSHTRGNLCQTPREPLSDAKENPVLKARSNLLLIHDQFGWDFLSNTKSLQANLSEIESHENDPVPKRKEADEPAFERWPQVTRFRNWKTAVRREVIASFTHHPRQASEWLAEIAQAISVQDLEPVGAVFGDNQMSFATLDSKIAKRLVKIVQSSREKFCWPNKSKNKKISPERINDLRVVDTNDLLNIELVNDNPEKFG